MWTQQLTLCYHPQFDAAALKAAKPVAARSPASPAPPAARWSLPPTRPWRWPRRAEKWSWSAWRPPPRTSTVMDVSEGILTVRGGHYLPRRRCARGRAPAASPAAVRSKMHEEEGCSRWPARPQARLHSPGRHHRQHLRRGHPHRFPAAITANFGRLMAWADKYRTLAVRNQRRHPRDAKKAAEFGAEAIGLCRTEHMFFTPTASQPCGR